MGECSVKVVVRFRPINARERQEEEDAANHAQLSDLSVDFPPPHAGEHCTSVNVMQGGKIKNAFVMDSVLQASVSQVLSIFSSVLLLINLNSGRGF